MIFTSGRETWVILMLLILLCIYLSSLMIKRNIPYKLRDIGSLDAVDEAIARCAEMGRPVLVSLGKRAVRDKDSVAAVPILSYIATKCAEVGSQLITCTCQPDWQPLAETIVEEGYKVAGLEEAYNPDNVRFISPMGYAYVTGMLGIVNREKVGTTFMLGGYGGEVMILSEGAGLFDSMVLSINGAYSQTYSIIVSAAYTAIGEEAYAASAYLGTEEQRINLFASDVIKIVSIGACVIGVILTNLGVI